MKICHVITGVNAGGAEIALCRLLESMRSPDFQHVVVALGGEGTLSGRLAESARLHHMGIRPGRAGPGDVLRLRRLLASESADLVHAWMYHAHLMTSLALWGQPVPHLWSVHHSLTDLATDKRLTRVVIRLNAVFSSRPRCVLYASQLSASQHEDYGFSRLRTVVIPNGYDTSVLAPDPVARARIRHELAVPDDCLVIGMVARVHPTKDHGNFLRAAKQFRDSYPDSVFVLVGDGTTDANAELAGLIDALQLRAHVRLLGRRTDIPAINAAFDIATLASRGEAFPNAVAEAMACGVPCVATDVGDVPMIVADTGVVVPTRDAVALSAGWASIAALAPRERRTLGSRARQRIVNNYTGSLRTRRYADLYSSIVQEHSACAE
jgi:glycosyltransferase involved in cell wall biosynthesis